MGLRFSSVSVLFVALLFAGAAKPASATPPHVIDRILATVNGFVILQSDLDEALAYEALLSKQSLENFSEEDRHTILDRLIDQELLREQMRSADFRHASKEEVESRIVEARKQYPQAETEESWQTLLAGFGITEQSLFSHVQQQIEVMRLVDARLRPAVQIDSRSIEAYYRDQFVPKLRQTGSDEVPLAEVSGKIRELLTQEKVSQMLVSWLQTLRSQGEVRIPGVAPPTDSGVLAR